MWPSKFVSDQCLKENIQHSPLQSQGTTGILKKKQTRGQFHGEHLVKNTSCGTHQISYAQNTPFSKIAFVDIKSRRQYTQKSIIVNDRQSVEQKMKFTENQFHRVYEAPRKTCTEQAEILWWRKTEACSAKRLSDGFGTERLWVKTPVWAATFASFHCRGCGIIESRSFPPLLPTSLHPLYLQYRSNKKHKH